MKTAIVHDWLITYAGAERVLAEIIRQFPEADLYSLIDFIPTGKRDFLLNKPVKTSFLQKFPRVRAKYRSYLPLMPLAIEQFDMSEYDLIISSNFAVAKGVITGPDQLHVCMCYSPMRYAWDLTHHYLKTSGLSTGLKGWLAKSCLHKIRIWDCRASHGVDEFIAISDYIAGRIKKAYRRESTVIYPPVDTDGFSLCKEKEDFYLTASRMVPYKNTDLIVGSFSKMPDKQLIVIGDGPEFDKIKKMAGPNVTLLGYQPFNVMRDYLQKARALVFAAEEDFGIIPLEAQSCGTPVIAYGRGGALETVIDGKTGIFFDGQEIPDVIRAISRFEEMKDIFNPEEIRTNALRFSTDRFQTEFKSFMDKAIEKYFKSREQGTKRPGRLEIKGRRETGKSPDLFERGVEKAEEIHGRGGSAE